MFWMDFYFFSRNFLGDLCFWNPLACSPCYVALTFFSITKEYFAPHLKYNVFLLSDWKKKLLRRNDSFIPANMDADFPEIQTCFSHNMKNCKRYSFQGHYGFHSFPVVDWFCLFIYLWVLTFPLEDCSEFVYLLLPFFNGKLVPKTW